MKHHPIFLIIDNTYPANLLNASVAGTEVLFEERQGDDKAAQHNRHFYHI